MVYHNLIKQFFRSCLLDISQNQPSQKSAHQALLEPSNPSPTPFSNKTLSRVYLGYTWCCIWETFCWQCYSLQIWPRYFLKSPIHPTGRRDESSCISWLGRPLGIPPSRDADLNPFLRVQPSSRVGSHELCRVPRWVTGRNGIRLLCVSGIRNYVKSILGYNPVCVL